MERIRLYLVMIGLILSVASCSDSDFTETLPMPQYTEVSLTLDLPFDREGRSARAFVDGTPAYDETTELQESIAEGDICVLGFQNDRLAAFQCGVSSQVSGSIIRLNFRFAKSDIKEQNIEFAVLANLSGNLRFSVSALLQQCIGLDSRSVYEQLTYRFSGEWDLSRRRIPMWGITPMAELRNGTTHLNLPCQLFRAVAKVGFRINVDPRTQQALGYEAEQMRILEVKVRNAMNAGFIAPLSHQEGTSIDNSGPYPSFVRPFVPSQARPLGIEAVYANVSPETFTREFVNAILLPEQETANGNLSFVVRYSLRGVEQPSREIRFQPGENIIRNHSYIYNISLSPDRQLEIDYQVVPWGYRETVELPFH